MGRKKFKSNDAVLNLIMAEVALILAPMGRDIRAVHLWTQRNVTCDRLSRLRGEGPEANAQMQLPEELLKVPRSRRRTVEYKVMNGQRVD